MEPGIMSGLASFAYFGVIVPSLFNVQLAVFAKPLHA